MARDRDRKKATGQPKKPEDDAMEDIGGLGPNDRRDPDEEGLSAGLGSDKEDDVDDDSGEERIAMNTSTRVPRKQTATKTPARLTAAEDHSECTAWYEHFLGVKANTAEYLHDQEDLTKPSTWVKLNEKTISMILKGCRDQNIHVSASAVNKMALLAFLCMHHERIQRPLLDMTSIDEDMLDDIERQKKLEDHYKDDKPTSDPPSLTLDDANVTKSISALEEDIGRRRGIMGHPLKYVIRHTAQVLAAHLDLPFGAPDSPYVSMDHEMIGRAQIFSREVNCDENDGPFSKVFLIDAAHVFALMEKAFGKTSFWTNARQYSRRTEGLARPYHLSNTTLVMTDQ
jgi:hypothetical protein